MKTLFISDLHLDDARPDATALFENLLTTEARSADALYILGDLFEYWLGDDVVGPCGQRARNAIRKLTDRGVPCFFQHGNRDFLLGKAFADACGMTLLDEEVVIRLDGRCALLLHGDSLCIDDVEYQAVRKMLRSQEWQQEFLARTPQGRIEFARDARQKSLAHQMNVSMDIMDVNQDAVLEALERHGVDLMIHGHTHRPAIHDLTTPAGPARRVVLGDWYRKGSLLRAGQGEVELVEL